MDNELLQKNNTNVNTMDYSYSENTNADIAENAENEKIKKFLVFISDKLYFSVNADHIIEIIVNHSVTHLPKVPNYIKGIINLRGQIIPVIDIRLRLGRPGLENTSDACIVVIEVNTITIGILVDSVSNVVDINIDNISPPPANNQQALINGIIHLDTYTSLFLDCEKLVHDF